MAITINTNCMYKKILLGIIAGIISGLFTAGGGMIAVPAFVHIFKLDEAEARATSVFVILPMVIASGLLYYRYNYIDWRNWDTMRNWRYYWRNCRGKIIKKSTRLDFESCANCLASVHISKNDYCINRRGGFPCPPWIQGEKEWQRYSQE